jgi:hypothetical protein
MVLHKPIHARRAWLWVSPAQFCYWNYTTINTTLSLILIFKSIFANQEYRTRAVQKNNANVLE